MSSVDFLVKLRDASQMIADAATEQLEKMTPEIMRSDLTKDQTFNDVNWDEKEGSNNNPYEQATKTDNKNFVGFEALQQILSEHNGFWQSKTHKYWFHQNDRNTIDRRKK